MIADQFNKQSTRYNAARQAAQANEGTSVYDSCDDQLTRDFIKKLTTEITIILAPYEFIHISIKLAKFDHFPLCMMNCIETLDEILNNYQHQAKVYGLDHLTMYSLRDLLDAQRKYLSDFDEADHRLRQTPPPSEGLRKISLFDEHDLDMFKTMWLPCKF